MRTRQWFIVLITCVGVTVSVQPPEFLNVETELNGKQISENTPVGTSIFQVRAIDREDGNPLQFFITGDSFDITDAGLNAQQESLGDITVAKILDRETNPIITFALTVRDGIGGHEITYNDIHVNIVDYNDNSPQFQNTPYETSISETADIGTSIFQVAATDIDSGANGAINFHLTSNTNSFDIDSVSGWITLKDRTDIESESETAYAVTVQATDGGNPSLSTSVDVFVAVDDVQNRAPVWIGEPYDVSIKEGDTNSRLGATVLTVQGRDGDRSNTNSVRYQLVRGDPSNYFNVGTTNGKFTLNQDLDREAPSIFSITTPGVFLLRIKGTEYKPDGTVSNPEQSSEVSVIIRVTDANDNLPEFNEQGYNVEITENPAVDTPLPRLRMTVSDKDSLPNNLFNLSVINDPNNVFDIEPKTVLGGQAIVNLLVNDPSQVDYETTPNHQIAIRVQATEFLPGGGNPQQTSVPVVINIKDAPESNNRIFNLDVTENSSPGTNVGTVRRDGETGVDFCIVGGNTNSTFAIDKSAGLVTLVTQPDREMKALYEIVIKKVPTGSNCPSGPIAYDDNDATLNKALITINDMNDNNPTFPTKVYYAGIPADTTFDRPITQVQAFDADAGVNSAITYSITSAEFIANRNDITGEQSRPVPNAFRVDPQTGQLQTNQLFTDYQNGYFTANVRARDGAGRTDDTEVRAYALPAQYGLSTVFDTSPDTLKPPRIQECLRRLEERTGRRVVYQGLHYGTNSQGNVNKQQSQARYYLVDDTTNMVLTSQEGMKVVDGIDWNTLRPECPPPAGTRSAQVGSDYEGFSNWEAFLVALAALLLLALLLLLCLLCYCRHWYKKKMHSKLLVEPVPEPATEEDLTPVFTEKQELETQLAIMDFGHDVKPDLNSHGVTFASTTKTQQAIGYHEYISTRIPPQELGNHNAAFTMERDEEPVHTTVFTRDPRGTSTGYTTGAADGEVVSTTVFSKKTEVDNTMISLPVYDGTYYEHEQSSKI
ncbi:cadherin-related family member 1-like [Branchiostoma lanceolatum]|uniref:cadherin-related family member 1-like n=1 Tax=Branchiostoma lanceolatum TaxID=7740 RepID=UPI00345368FE